MGTTAKIHNKAIKYNIESENHSESEQWRFRKHNNESNDTIADHNQKNTAAANQKHNSK